MPLSGSITWANTQLILHIVSVTLEMYIVVPMLAAFVAFNTMPLLQMNNARTTSILDLSIKSFAHCTCCVWNPIAWFCDT